MARIAGEAETDLHVVGEAARQAALDFEEARTGAAPRDRARHVSGGQRGRRGRDLRGRRGHGSEGHLFAKLDTGMTEVMRASLYGAQHPIGVAGAEGRPRVPVVFVGRCCETGDMLTPAPGDTSKLAPREVPRPEIGDLVLIGGAGAPIGAAMSTVNYNSYPAAPEVLEERDGTLHLWVASDAGGDDRGRGPRPVRWSREPEHTRREAEIMGKPCGALGVLDQGA